MKNKVVTSVYEDSEYESLFSEVSFFEDIITDLFVDWRNDILLLEKNNTLCSCFYDSEDNSALCTWSYSYIERASLGEDITFYKP